MNERTRMMYFIQLVTEKGVAEIYSKTRRTITTNVMCHSGPYSNNNTHYLKENDVKLDLGHSLTTRDKIK